MSGADSNHNKMTRHEWLRRVVYSSDLTRVAQHLALIIYAMSELSGSNIVKASARDLERMTGWGKSAIADHLAELEVFINVTFGTGRSKTLFELQGLIEDVLSKAVVSASRTQEEPKPEASVQQADATVDTKPSVQDADALADATADTSAKRTEEQRVASASRTQTKESFPPYPPSKKTSPTGEGEGKIAPAPASLKTIPSPHLNGVGFVISAEHDLIVPKETVDRWRTRFTDIPDLEAQMQKLASYILKGGIMHPGWSCPEGWMVGCLAEDNRRAADKTRITNAKIANTNHRNQPTKTFRR